MGDTRADPVVDTTTREDYVWMVAFSLGAVGQIVRVNSDTVSTNQAGGKSQEFHFVLAAASTSLVSKPSKQIRDNSIFHGKTGIIKDKTGDRLAFNGSTNEIEYGWTRNWESFDAFTSWNDGPRVDEEEASFAKLWADRAGPGVGKSTIVKAILRILAAKGARLLLCAPTGCAAKRMTEAAGFED